MTGPERQASSPGVSRRGFLRLAGSAATAGLAVPTLASCGGSGGGGGEGTVDVYWNAGHSYDAYAQVIDAFEKDHGVTVNWQKFQWPDLRTKILADFSSGNVPDLVEEPGGWIPEFGLTGDLLPLDSYVKKDGKEMGFPKDWQPYTVRRNTVHDKVYGVQLHLTCILNFYNEDYLKVPINPASARSMCSIPNTHPSLRRA
ncbi:MAG: ABC transporter substrate-binding protein [Streptosporangiaceae bacterium]